MCSAVKARNGVVAHKKLIELWSMVTHEFLLSLSLKIQLDVNQDNVLQSEEATVLLRTCS